MDNILIISLIVAIAVLLVVFWLVASRRNKGQIEIPNYRALFVIGISWLPIGIATSNPGLWGMGTVFFIVGLANKKKWGEETKWADLSPRTKQIKMIVIGGLTVLVLLSVFYYFLTKSN